MYRAMHVAPAAEARTALRLFVQAVRAFAEDTSDANVDRYLVASRELEDSRRTGRGELSRLERLRIERETAR
jgi:hypothetical protein